MDAFTTIAELEKRIGRTFPAERVEQIDQLLKDASTYLRDDVIGYTVYPQTGATFTTTPDSSGELVLPQQPVVEVASVTRDGDPVEYTYRDGSVFVRDAEEITVTFTYGYATPPESLVRWTCVLVSQVLTTLEMNLGLSVGGLSSIQIDEFRAAFADGGAHTGMQLSPMAEHQIRRQFRPDVAIGGLR